MRSLSKNASDVALEPRLMFSVSPPGDAWAVLGFPPTSVLLDSELVSDMPLHDGALDPLPAIPFDDSISPVGECPDLGEDYCLPGDATQDGVVDFLDFLMLNQNFGLENASWDQGDFNGDGVVDFADLLLLSDNYAA